MEHQTRAKAGLAYVAAMPYNWPDAGRDAV